jgi:hypothetical protein
MDSIRNINRNLIALPRFVGENPELLKRREPETKPFVSALEKSKRRIAVSLPVMPNFVKS